MGPIVAPHVILETAARWGERARAIPIPDDPLPSSPGASCAQSRHRAGRPKKARPELFVDMNMTPKDQIDLRDGLRSLPPLLKGYVRAGCCIGDGAVIDRQFGTTDVFIYFPLSGIDARYKSRFGLVK